MRKKDLEKCVLKALENKKYNWRTVEGLEKELKINKIEINGTLEDLITKRTVVSPRSRYQGKPVYTTVNHYKQTKGIIGRVLDIIAGEVKI